MSYKPFTPEEKEILSKSEYVIKVTDYQVQFTPEFKREILKIRESGVGSRDALRILNIDPNILGDKRIDTMFARFRAQSRRAEGFSRKPNSSKGKKRKKRFENDKDALAYYKEYAQQLEQELEFIKKLEALEKSLARKPSRAKNSK